jgi:hypothetical protein
MAYSVSFSGRQGAITYVIGTTTIDLPMTEWTATRSTDAIDGTNFTSRYPNEGGPFNQFGTGELFETGTAGSVASQEVAPGYNKISIEARGYPSCETGVPGGSSVVPLPVIGQRVEFRLYPVVGNDEVGTIEEQYYCRINSVNYSLNVRGVLEYTITAATAGPPPSFAAAASQQAIGAEPLTYLERMKKRKQEVVKEWKPEPSRVDRFAPPKTPKPDPVPPAPVPPTPPEPEPEAP